MLPASPVSSSPCTTARQIIEIIQQNIGIPWRPDSSDTFKIGNPDDEVKGVAVTMVASLDVLRKATASGKNLIISHEPVFYTDSEQVESLEREHDAVYSAKREVIEKHGLILWRLHDHWHDRDPDGILTGMIRTLKWEGFQSALHPHLFNLPETTVAQLATQLKNQLNIRALRVVGDADMKVRHVALSPGFAGFDVQRHLLQREDVEVLVLGEAHDWETIAYAADAQTARQRKALIDLGHVPSEQGGMEEFARWLAPLIPQVPIKYIPTLEPFWTPD